MRRVYVSTLFRREGERGSEGRVYALNWENKAVLWSRETSGVRGLAFHKNVLYVATFNNTIHSVDTGTGELSEEFFVFHPASFLHKIYFRDDCLYLPSAGNDSLVLVNPNTMTVQNVEHLSAANRDTYHFNSMGWDYEGQEYHLYHSLGTVYNKSTKIPVFTGLAGAHDLEFISPELVITNHSPKRRAVVGNLRTGELDCFFEAPDGPSTSVAAWGWTRGAAVGEDVILTGSAPVFIHEFNRYNLDKIDEFMVSDCPDESIFDICLDPRDWS